MRAVDMLALELGNELRKCISFLIEKGETKEALRLSTTVLAIHERYVARTVHIQELNELTGIDIHLGKSKN